VFELRRLARRLLLLRAESERLDQHIGLVLLGRWMSFGQPRPLVRAEAKNRARWRRRLSFCAVNGEIGGDPILLVALASARASSR
jgi:hypothetical protein